MKPSDSHTDMISRHLRQRLSQWRRRLFAQRLISTAVVLAICVPGLRLMDVRSDIAAVLLLAVGLLMIITVNFSQRWRKLTLDNFVSHLNRRFKDFEESAQLLLETDQALTTMQSLQRDRVLKVYRNNLDQAEQWQPPLLFKRPLAIIAICAVLAWFAGDLRSVMERLRPFLNASPVTSSQQHSTERITDINIRIYPPAYMGLAELESQQPDLEVHEGSRIEWHFSFDANADRYLIEMSAGERIELLADHTGHWQVATTAVQTDLYRIIAIDNDQEQPIGDIYSLTVILDQVPDVRIIEPLASILEVAKDDSAVFISRALVSDDFGIQSVNILASVAKGSGESVKFRDQTLEFDSHSESDKGLIYQRKWDLKELGMKPGDEVYFTVIATDNRQPKANTGRSETIIVRWLDDAKTTIAAEGLAIDFIPEFFKSQRQIIIDTEQLIEDRENLESQQFKDTSYGIGEAQAFLKHKYGQYMGDEVAEGAGEQLGIMHEIAESLETAEGESEGVEDDHGHEAESTVNTRINNMTEVINLFGHNHGDPEIGPITQRNPVGMMKRAINEMWQAERHLMQAEPDLALPFEYEAYKYLKLARQAERIYVKRLGFEPPPVTEERRLTGELDDILVYRTTDNAAADNLSGERADQQLLRNAYQLLSSSTASAEFSPQQTSVLAALSDHLKRLSQQRPALIKQAASVEKLLSTGRLFINNCNDCLDQLKTTVWNLLDSGSAQLTPNPANYYLQDALIQSYQAELSKPQAQPGLKGDNTQP